ncbi:hypothetical protein [Bacillus sp. FJAT-27445]|uniref:hypothetical protein n=1 Tax=Bacillus sp. FJAT-27445 TaxID=1679166 RepID=UPI0007439D3F|nr:hypothetical protein [Bacillus sp. FJAT-27445]
MNKIVEVPLKIGKLVTVIFIEKLTLLLKVIGVRASFYILTIVALYYYYHQKSLDVLLPIIIGIFISDLIKSLYENFLMVKEDKLKTTHSMKYLQEIYQNNYNKELVLNESNIEFLYNDSFVNQKDFKIMIEDAPNKMFDPDPLIKSSYSEIMKAHKGSYIKNFETIRLDGYTLNETTRTLTLLTSRSNFYNHLLTNRAIDYEFEPGLSVRKIFEYGPRLNKFETTKMSNHIGINGIVQLSDGYTILPKRGTNATYSKNKMTASIASPLISSHDKNGTVELTYEGLKNEVISLLNSRLYIDTETISDPSVEVIFLGFGREIYEGGKPQFYFLVKLNSLSSQDYLQILKDKKKKMKNNKSIDKDSNLYICNLLSLKLKKNYSGSVECINYYTDKIKFKSVEFSFLANVWHVKEAGYLEHFNVDQIENENIINLEMQKKPWEQLKKSV